MTTPNYVASNFGTTTLAGALTPTSTSFTVYTGQGSRLPTVNNGGTGSDYTKITLQKADGTKEIVTVVRHDTGTDVCTIGVAGTVVGDVAGRAQEGTTAANWSIGDVVACRPTAAVVAAGANAPAAAAAAAAVAAAIIPSGTAMLFAQTNAPTGWTKSTTHNDKALRVVSGAAGSGGTAAFSTVFGQSATGGHAVTTAEMPIHTHSTNDAGHAHGVNDPGHAHLMYGFQSAQPASGGALVPYGVTDNSRYTEAATTGITIGSAATGVTVGNAGSGNAHTHAMDIRVQYVDTIIATKD